MKAPHPVLLAAMRLDGLGQALLAGQPVAVSGLALSETAAVMYAAAAEIRELRAQVAALAQAEAGAQVQAERDSLLSGLREAVQVWTQKRESNRRDGDRRAEIIYSAVVSRALDILNDQEAEESAQAEAGACDTCADVTDNIGQINYCYRCGRRFPEHVAEEITVAEFIAREAPNWADVTDPVAWVREMRGDAPDVELEAHWKAGFLRGAKFWYGKVEGGWTMWQSEQNECWQAAGRLWPAVRPESLEDARQVAQAQAGAGGEGQGEGA